MMMEKLTTEEKAVLNGLVQAAEKRARKVYSRPLLGLVAGILVMILAVFGVDLLQSSVEPILDQAWGTSNDLAQQPVTHENLRQYAELQAILTVNSILILIFQMLTAAVFVIAIWHAFTSGRKAKRDFVQIKALKILLEQSETSPNTSTEHANSADC